MKAAAFEYQKVQSVAQALSLLQTYGDDARLIAGGQSLLPSLNMRLSSPTLLVDLNGVQELKGITKQDQVIRIGAMTTHTEIENSELIKEFLPMLSQAVPHIAHRAIRNLGTWGGSIVYGDPAAEWPACAIALNATMVIASSHGQRRVAAQDFFQDIYTVDLSAEEILVATEFPLSVVTSWNYFDELSRRHGDYAIAGIAMHLKYQAGKVESNEIVFFSVGSTPLRALKTSQLLNGQNTNALAGPSLNLQLVNQVKEEISTLSDLTNSAMMKTHLVGVLLGRALKQIPTLS